MYCEEARKGWDAGAVPTLSYDYRLPGSGWHRVLSLWGFVGVPFLRAFRTP